MTRRRGRQKGPQRHAEGQHGEKTHRHLIEQLQSGEPEPPSERSDPEHRTRGKHRMFENREQHDEADKNPEKTRLSRDIDRHKHNRENFQVVGGAESGRAMPRSRTNPGEPNAPSRGLPSLGESGEPLEEDE